MLNLEVKYERLNKLIERLILHASDGASIIVEGKKDKLSLKRLGVEKGVLCLKASDKNFYDFTALIKGEAVLMVDFDKEGEDLALKLTRELTKMKIKVNNSIWRRIRDLTKPEVKSIEELANYMEKIKSKILNAT
ncbi:toprim domain-containing protein [Candidatus Bathyarchaeota archaeon]|nr:toprim domain-containing protein [Candidatus Bathyarchaeota archaeon]